MRSERSDLRQPADSVTDWHKLTWLRFAGNEASLIEVVDVGRDGDVRGVSIVEEVGETDFKWDRGYDFAEAGELEVFHLPDFQHEGAKVFADEGEFAGVEIDGVEVMKGEGGADGIVGRRKRIDEMEEVCEVSPENFLFESGEAEGSDGTLLGRAGVFFGLQVLALEFVGEPLEAISGKVVAKEFDGVGVGEVEVGVGVEASQPG